MALSDGTESEPPPPPSGRLAFWRKLLGKQNAAPHSSIPCELPRNHELDHEEPWRPAVAAQGLAHGHGSRKVVTCLPRSQTFKRQQSEQRVHLAPVLPTADERRAASVDRRSQSRHKRVLSQPSTNPRVSAPGLLGSSHDAPGFPHYPSFMSASQTDHGPSEQSLDQMSVASQSRGEGEEPAPDAADSMADAQSMTASQHEAMINDELERTWILNLSMHFRDRSKREKFFVTYREQEHLWRRVTISLDYRFAPSNSLEMDLIHTKYQREKSAKIYEAIRESLLDIKFYDTVTNLKLETTDGRLHVHVVEDGNEIINYPRVDQVRHLGCRRIRERDIVFDSHMSGFVYKVSVHGQVLIKKEIPSQDTIEEFLYEVNALNSLRYSHDVVRFYGVVVDDQDDHVKGLLISYASQGALIDIIFEHCKENNYGLPWATKERWARQIVRGLADVHDSGFVQGDFTLSNIVIDDADNAKIIDINRRGCPVGWEPPEATALIDAGHRITMYIGVKSDLYQLGMVLWALAMEEDEPEGHGRPLMLGPEINVPDWYRQMTEMCLSADPRMRLQASLLLQMFPPAANDDEQLYAKEHAISVDDGHSVSEYFVDGHHADGRPLIRTVEPPSDWPYSGRTYVDTSPVPYEPYYPVRGRSPPSPLPSDLDICESSRDPFSKTSWAANRSVRPSYTDAGADETMSDDVSRHDNDHTTPTPTAEVDDAVEHRAREASQHKATKDADLSIVPGALTSHDAAAVENMSPPKQLGVASDELFCPVAATEVAPIPKLAREETAINTALLGSAQAGSADDAAPAAVKESETTAARPMAEFARDTVEESQLANACHEMRETTREASSGDDAEKVASTITEGHSKPQGQASASHDGGRGTELEREPEDVATQASGSTELGTNMHKSKDGAPAASTAEYAAHRPVGDSYSTKKWLANLDGFNPPISKEVLRGRQKPDCSRQISLPVSLTGIGAAHMGIDDELMRGKSIIDDDFSTIVRSATVPALMITTDSRT
ncbi:Uncharacterized protein TPAR_03597 [Tolypocladium paradoxum]|uniref:Protein kinase domain-containing protein n=1 Tax=Tolypocladium paradoxum TaxID=94208 RepID=A0A2S4L1G0_9HYPO|nr:Uncharacterized protein TPAR_03597 [Tolypocladium paradoxum]